MPDRPSPLTHTPADPDNEPGAVVPLGEVNWPGVARWLRVLTACRFLVKVDPGVRLNLDPSPRA